MSDLTNKTTIPLFAVLASCVAIIGFAVAVSFYLAGLEASAATEKIANALINAEQNARIERQSTAIIEQRKILMDMNASLIRIETKIGIKIK